MFILCIYRFNFSGVLVDSVLALKSSRKDTILDIKLALKNVILLKNQSGQCSSVVEQLFRNAKEICKALLKVYSFVPILRA